MLRSPSIILLSGSLYIWLLSAAGLQAGSPRDEVLRLVPDGAGFCLLAQDAREHFARLSQSPFAARFRESRLGRAILDSPEIHSIAKFEEQIAAAFQMSLSQLRDEVLGDAVALVYTPGPPDKPDQEQGMLIVHARQPERLATFIERLNELQKQSGEVRQIESRSIDGRTIVARRKRAGAEYYCLHGPILIFSDKEDSIRRTLEADRTRPGVEREPPSLARKMQAVGIESNPIVLWINPRAFDAPMQHKLAESKGPETAALRTFVTFWAALDGLALTARADSDLSLSLVVQARPDAMPPTVRNLFAELRRPSAAWSAFPSDALFVAAGRLSWPALTDLGREVVPTEGQKDVKEAIDRSVGAVLGRDTIPVLARAIGPDWGLCIEQPETAAKAWLPTVVAVLRIRAESSDVPIEKRVLDGLDFAARLAILGMNSQRAARWQLQTVRQGEVEVRIMDGDSHLPPGLQPAYAWKDGYLVLASSPEAIRRFTPSTANNPGPMDGAVPLVRIAVSRWAGYLRDHRAPLAKFAAERHQQAIGEINRGIDRLVDVLELFNSVELTQQSRAGQAALTLHFRTAAPLREPTKKPH